MAELIRDRFGIKLAVRTMGLYLERWGFTPQEPMKKAYEQLPATVKKWLDEEYPVIEACAKVEGAEIHWGDETGLRSDDVRGRGYAPQGQTPVIRVNNKCHGLLVLDKLRVVCHSKPVKAWLAEHKSEIEVFYLTSETARSSIPTRWPTRT